LTHPDECQPATIRTSGTQSTRARRRDQVAQLNDNGLGHVVARQ
jgi:hypothetical protein